MNLSIAAKEVSQAIQSLLHATQGLAPDQIKCDEALESLSEIMENLDGLALTASVCKIALLLPSFTLGVSSRFSLS